MQKIKGWLSFALQQVEQICLATQPQLEHLKLNQLKLYI